MSRKFAEKKSHTSWSEKAAEHDTHFHTFLRIKFFPFPPFSFPLAKGVVGCSGRAGRVPSTQWSWSRRFAAQRRNMQCTRPELETGTASFLLLPLLPPLLPEPASLFLLLPPPPLFWLSVASLLLLLCCKERIEREGTSLRQAIHSHTQSLSALPLSLCLSASLLSLYAPLLAGQTAMLEGQGKVRGGGGALALLVRTNLPPSLPPSPPPESQFSSHGSLWQQPICGGGTLDNITHILCYKTPCYDF